jgi:hypothetical protein
MSDEPVPSIDAVIDDVAREMTSTSAPHGFVERVEMRIASVAAPQRAIWTQPALLAPLAAACILVVTVFLVRHPTPPVEQLRTPAPSVAAAPTIVRRTEERSASPVPTVVPVQLVRVSPLPAIEIAPLDVERLDVTPIVQAQQLEIEIDPIAIARIEIAPMP